jgi:hypothetical protein
MLRKQKSSPLTGYPNILLLTATITPPSDAKIARRDPTIRLKDYINALKFYLPLVTQCIDYIIFAENSNSDISCLKALVNEAKLSDKVEFIVIYGLDYPWSYGRGYGEFKLIEHVMNHSKLINTYPKSIIWKVTGRYIIRNICHIIATKPPDFDIYCNFLNYSYFMNYRRTPYLTLYLLAWTPSGYQIGLKNIYQELRCDITKQIAEVTLRKILEQRLDKIKVIPHLKVPIRLDAIMAKANKKIVSWHPRQVLKYYVRRLLPWWWFD